MRKDRVLAQQGGDRFRAIRSARIFQPIENRQFVVDEIVKLTRLQQPGIFNAFRELMYVRELHATQFVDRVGIAKARRISDFILTGPLAAGFTFRIGEAEPYAEAGAISNGLIHRVRLRPDEATVDAIEKRVALIREQFGFEDDTFFRGLAVAACMSKEHAEQVAEQLNSAAQIRQLGIVLGSMHAHSS